MLINNLLSNCWLIINNSNLTFGIFSNSESLFAFNSLCCDFIACCNWSRSLHNLNDFLCCDVGDFLIVVNLFDDFCYGSAAVFLLWDSDFGFDQWSDYWFGLFFDFGYNDSLVVFLEDCLDFAGNLFTFDNQSVFVSIGALSRDNIGDLALFNLNLLGKYFNEFLNFFINSLNLLNCIWSNNLSSITFSSLFKNNNLTNCNSFWLFNNFES